MTPRFCTHCNRPFRNKQAVRAHLRWCPAWHEKREKPGWVRQLETAASRAKPARWQCEGCGARSATADVCPGCDGRAWRELEG